MYGGDPWATQPQPHQNLCCMGINMKNEEKYYPRIKTFKYQRISTERLAKLMFDTAIRKQESNTYNH